MSRRHDEKHRQDHKHRLGRTPGRRLQARGLARVGAAALAAASIGFAAPALAAHPDTPSEHAAAGQAHRPTTTHVDHGTTGHQHATHPTTHTTTPRTGGGSSSQAGSAVSLAKPNDFQAQADPDGMTNGGVDQPGGTGGVDTSSQDGNNGSGNDADCEDDNRGVGVPGHCKDRPATGSEGDTGSPLPGQVPGETSGQTSGETSSLTSGLTPQLQLTPSLTTVATGASSSLVSAPATSQVRGEARTHGAAAHPATGVLPETGAGPALLGLALAALVALGLGTGLVRRGRRAAQVAG